MKKDYIIYGLTEDQLKVACKEALNGNAYGNVRFIFNKFGSISHLEVSLTDKEAHKISRKMFIENLKDKDSHYQLICKGAA